eukprot:12045488-Prorocentrum_lima.AAC.1
MTSSLVGSEMCIRDSCNYRMCVSVRLSALLLNLPLVARVGCDGAKQMPVSYTHLTLPTICSV